MDLSMLMKLYENGRVQVVFMDYYSLSVLDMDLGVGGEAKMLLSL